MYIDSGRVSRHLPPEKGPRGRRRSVPLTPVLVGPSPPSVHRSNCHLRTSQTALQIITKDAFRYNMEQYLSTYSNELCIQSL